MIIEGEFFSHGLLRWNLGWPTPNYAGAFLASVLVWFWLAYGRRWQWWGLLLETAGLFLLCKTYSRGAVLAWTVAWMFGAAVTYARAGWASWARFWGGRILVVAGMILAVGFAWHRADQSGGDSALDDADAMVEEFADASVANRLALWKAGCAMVAASPVVGWGAGESGRAYMNWYQALDRAEGYTTMVNSYLTLAVERGLPLLGGTLVLSLGLVVLAAIESRERWVKDRRRVTLPMAAGACLIAWAIANLFTTLAIEPKLWIVPGCSALILVWRTRSGGGRRWRVAMLIALPVACAVVGGIYAYGRYESTNRKVKPRPISGGGVVLAGGKGGQKWHVWSDDEVLGKIPGRELRRWINVLPGEIQLTVHQPTDSGIGTIAGDEAVFLFGRQAERTALWTTRTWWIHPSGLPPAAVTPMSGSGVVLPEIDETGMGRRWREWGEWQGVPVLVSPRVGQDIRWAWPEVMLNAWPAEVEAQ